MAGVGEQPLVLHNGYLQEEKKTQSMKNHRPMICELTTAHFGTL